MQERCCGCKDKREEVCTMDPICECVKEQVCDKYIVHEVPQV